MNNNVTTVKNEENDRISRENMACRECQGMSGSCQDWCGNPAYPKCKASCPLYDD